MNNFICWKCKRRTNLRIKMNLNGKSEIINELEITKAPIMPCCNDHLKKTKELMELDFRLNELNEMKKVYV